jgi:preprotein translocase subunit Sec61beta
MTLKMEVPCHVQQVFACERTFTSKSHISAKHRSVFAMSLLMVTAAGLLKNYSGSYNHNKSNIQPHLCLISCIEQESLM